MGRSRRHTRRLLHIYIYIHILEASPTACHRALAQEEEKEEEEEEEGRRREEEEGVM